jgi:hypothetical protein
MDLKPDPTVGMGAWNAQYGKGSHWNERDGKEAQLPIRY